MIMRKTEKSLLRYKICSWLHNPVWLRIKNSHGFTMMELIVVFSVMGILTAISIVSYSSYSNTQSFQSASADVISMLQTAKSRSLSQVKPPSCTGRTLFAYQVVLDIPGSTYRMEALCDNTANLVVRQDLPDNVTFTSNSNQKTVFNVISGTVNTPGTISLTGYGKTKVITVSGVGGISSY